MPKRAREDVADCSICCEPLQHDTPMAVQMLCCFQILHICCVQKWERNTRFRTCALCRSEQESHRSQREVDDLVKKACDFQLAEAGALEKKSKATSSRSFEPRVLTCGKPTFLSTRRGASM